MEKIRNLKQREEPVRNLKADSTNSEDNIQGVRSTPITNLAANLGGNQSTVHTGEGVQVSNLKANIENNQSAFQTGGGVLASNLKANLGNNQGVFQTGGGVASNRKAIIGGNQSSLQLGEISVSNLKANIASNRMSFTPLINNSSPIVRLRVEPFNFLNFTQWECEQELNEHGVLRISGLISEKDADSYYGMAGNELWVNAIGITEEGDTTTLMHGVLTSCAIQSDKQVHHMTIEVRTGSFLLDRTPCIRSFQRETLQYGEVFEACVGAEGGQFIMRDHRSQPIRQLLVQYHETTWAFAKRLAYKLGLVILPEPRLEGKRLYIGLDEGGVQEITSNDFQMSVAAPEQEDLIWREGGIYQVRSRQVYQLGQQVSFLGRRLRIGKLISSLSGQELWHEYTLYMPRPAFTRDSLNDKIRGVSLLAMVTNVERDKVRVSIHDDLNKHLCGDRLFDYATVYSTPDGTGWYCMPEIGDEVRLVFPEADESAAYVTSSVHLATKGGRVNPDHKSWRNKQNKEILFTPDSLVLRNNQGLSIELSDSNGITIISDTGISLQSDQGIQINSQNANITMAADNNVSISQGTAAISMSDSIDISGGKINMN